MKPLNKNLLFSILPTLLTAIGVGLAAINHQPVLGMAAVALVEAGRRWRARQLTLGQLSADASFWLVGWSSAIIIALNTNLKSQIFLTILYGVLRWQLSKSKVAGMWIAAFIQGIVLWAIFLASAVWHWQTLIVLVLAWLSAWLIAKKQLEGLGDRVAEVLALTWALIVAECSWIFSLWLVNYIIFNGFLIIPQPALVITALGYCLAGIYSSHRRSQLSRSRLIEYLMIGLTILAIVIAGTRWNGVI